MNGYSMGFNPMHFKNNRRSATQSFTRYRMSRLYIPLFIAGYIGLANMNPPQYKTEIYPFFNWSLYSHSSAPIVTRIELKVLSINEEMIDPPERYFSLKSQFHSASQQDSRLIKLLRNMYTALENNDTKQLAAIRSIVESHFLTEANTADYKLVKLTYDPLDAIVTGDYIDSATLRQFRKEP